MFRFREGLSMHRVAGRCAMPIVAAVSTLGSAQAQNIDWVAKYGTPSGGSETAQANAVDASGNVYVAGSTFDGDYDVLVVKYDMNGNRLWARRYDDPLHSNQTADKVAVDGNGNVVVAGSTTASNGYLDYLAIKYDSNGNRLWLRTYNGHDSRADFVTGLALDEAGNVYVAGSVTFLATATAYATVKYSPAGKLLWVRTFEGSLDFANDTAMGIVVDPSGNAIVTGFSAVPATGDDIVTLKYAPDGHLLWKRRFSGTASAGSDRPNALVTDASGNVVVTGSVDHADSGANQDLVVLKYAPGGNLLWSRVYNDAANGDEQGRAVAVDAVGRIFVTGNLSDGDSDIVTLGYSPTGHRLWVRRFHGSSEDAVRRIVTDADSNVVIAGFTTTLNLDIDMLTIKYAPNGDRLWIHRFGSADDDEDASGLSVDSLGHVLVSGTKSDFVTGADFLTVKYKP